MHSEWQDADRSSSGTAERRQNEAENHREKDGRRLIISVNGKQPDPGEIGDVLHTGELGSPAQYEISGGRLITTIHMTPFEVRIYKFGDKYFAARSNEFGFAN
jgi:hypothetical protein